MRKQVELAVPKSVVRVVSVCALAAGLGACSSDTLRFTEAPFSNPFQTAQAPASQRDPATTKAKHTIHVWSLAQRRKLIEVGGIVDTPYDLAFSADEKYLAGTFQDGSVRLWDLAEYLPAKK